MQLIKYDAMCKAINECECVDEVKDLRDKALALEVYAKQAKNMDAERKATNVRLRAERRCGQILSVMEKAKPPGDNQYGKKDRFPKSTEAKTLKQMNISKKESSRFQKLAKITPKEFEKALADPKEKKTTIGLIAANEKKEPKEKPKKMDADALWLWGRFKEFETSQIFERDEYEILDEYTDAMMSDIIRIYPKMLEFIKELGEKADEYTNESNNKRNIFRIGEI